MVWRSYVSVHADFFQNGDVEGVPNEDKCSMASLDIGLDETLIWATQAIIHSLKCLNNVSGLSKELPR